MNELPFSPRIIVLTGVLCVAIALGIYILSLLDTRTKLVFCDVGQGDGAYIRVNNRIDIVIDAGPERDILNCLGKHMPFFDRTIEFAFITHPQKDHFGGFRYVIERYDVKTFLLPPVENDAQMFQKFKKDVQKTSDVVFPYDGDKLKIHDARITMLWPTKEYIQRTVHFQPQDDGYGETSTDLNAFSLVFAYDEGGKRVLFTGDALPEILNILAKRNYGDVDILKVPHHGSVNGTTAQFLKAVDPGVSVMSVGKNNRFNHPSPEIIALFEELNEPVRRTDEEGDIVYRIW